ncbi:MAG: hypothetical protein K2Y28_02420 [Burkholderiaceae bacterium]|nr:hypothetical protein [Burkholderiaceae bacterium]
MKIEKSESFIEPENFFKKIRKLWKDKKIASFTISVHLYREDLSEPLIVSAQGERTPDGSVRTWFPKNRNPAVLQSHESLKVNLTLIGERVRQYIMLNGLDKKWEKFEKEINKKLESGLSIEELEVSFVFIELTSYPFGYDAHFYAPIMATAYARYGIEALKKVDLNRASYCVERGQFWLSDDALEANPGARFAERARRGGLRKNSKYDPVKDEVVELLTRLAPDEGWANTNEAVETVTNNLIERDFAAACDLDFSNLPRTIKGWIRRNPKRFVHHIKPKA